MFSSYYVCTASEDLGNHSGFANKFPLFSQCINGLHWSRKYKIDSHTTDTVKGCAEKVFFSADRWGGSRVPGSMDPIEPNRQRSRA